MKKLVRTLTLGATAGALVIAPLAVSTAANALTIGCPGSASGPVGGCDAGGDAGHLVIGTPGGAGL